MSDNYVTIKVFVVSLFSVFLLFAWQGGKGLDLGDEGYLWYGAQRVMLGEVPIRDFMAYDPGRYYWSAAIMEVVGNNGIMTLRTANVLFQLLGVFVGVMLIARSIKGYDKNTFIFLIVSTQVLLAWMFSNCKLYDSSFSLFMIAALSFLIKDPIPRRFFITGVCIGVAAVFGRNHGVYGLIGGLVVTFLLQYKKASATTLSHELILLGSGIIVGFSPIVIMVLLVPGFAIAFWKSIVFLVTQGATNLPLPVPWPWRPPLVSRINGVVVGMFFVAILVFGVVGILWVLSQKMREKELPPAFVASVALALPYAHYAFSRADAVHLAQGVFPALIGSLAIIASKGIRFKWLFAGALFLISIIATYPYHPGYQCRGEKRCVNIEVSGSTIKVSPSVANVVVLLRDLVDQYAVHGEGFIAAPLLPGAYPLFERRAPMWEIYALFPQTEGFQREEIDRIKLSRPAFVYLVDVALDGREELRFRNTNPLIYRYVVDNFEAVSDSLYINKNKSISADRFWYTHQWVQVIALFVVVGFLFVSFRGGVLR